MDNGCAESSVHSDRSDDNLQYGMGSRQIEPIFDAFICPLTKEIMSDPVTIENGQTFEREAIEKWFRDCREKRKNPTCPLTLKELRSTELNPSIALRNAIEEWNHRNDIVKIDLASRSLYVGSVEGDALRGLKYVQEVCQKRRSLKLAGYKANLVPRIIEMLKHSSNNVRSKALETLRIVAEDDPENKEIMAEGDTVRTIVKFLQHEHSQEKDEAVCLLYELSKSELLSEKIGEVNGSILLLIGMSSSVSENLLTVDRAERTLQNLEMCEKNVYEMAMSGRLQPLLNLLQEGSSDTKITMATYLSQVVLSNDDKVLVADMVGSDLVEMLQTGDAQAREAALKALNQVSSYEASAKILIEEGILPPLVRDLFTVSVHQVPMKVKEQAAAVLANVVNTGFDFASVPATPDGQTLVSEDIVHKLLHLISNTGPTIETKLLQVLVGLAGSPTVLELVSAIRSSGATISLVQFIEVPQPELRLVSLKLLCQLSPLMDQELADALRAAPGQLTSLLLIINIESSGILEEQAAAIGLLADLPPSDMNLTRRLLGEGAFKIVIGQLRKIRRGETWGGRFVTPYTEGLVRVLARVTYVLEEEPDAVRLAQDHDLAAIFRDLLQPNALNEVQRASCVALMNLSLYSKKLSKQPVIPKPSFLGTLFGCLRKPPAVPGLCRIHHGICSFKETFCLLDGNVVHKLVACLDYDNDMVVEASLGALSSLLADGVDVQEGMQVLCEFDGVRPIFDILVSQNTEALRKRSVWAVERLLSFESIAVQVSDDANVSSALVEAYKHGDIRTRQIAERALKHIERIPNFSDVFQKLA